MKDLIEFFEEELQKAQSDVEIYTAPGCNFGEAYRFEAYRREKHYGHAISIIKAYKNYINGKD